MAPHPGRTPRVGLDDPTAPGRCRADRPRAGETPQVDLHRFEAELPNECWQSDFTHYFLLDGTETEILVWLDDHSRYALSVTAHRRVTGPIVVDRFNRTGETEGFPASTLTDNGLVYTARFAGSAGKADEAWG